MKTVELVYYDAGGGHRSAANALCDVARREGRPVTMRMTNLGELLSEFDVCRRLTGHGVVDLYNGMLRHGWTLGTATLLRTLQGMVRLTHQVQVRHLVRHWKQDRPDIVVSLIPNFNRAMCDAIGQVMPLVPFVTILTDFADYPPHFWIERDQRQYFIVGTDRARRQALEAGHAAERVFLTSGMILNPKFYDPVTDDRARDIAALGLDPSLPTAIMMFGGEGSADMPRIAQRLDESGLDLQLIAVCGKNVRLETAMRNAPRRIRMHVTGFVDDVARLMRPSDFFIGKPGPASISEALVMGLPVIVERNRWTMPQERYNTEWVEEQGVGISIPSFRRGIVGAAREMLDPLKRRQLVEHVKAQHNRAVFEIPEILERILD